MTNGQEPLYFYAKTANRDSLARLIDKTKRTTDVKDRDVALYTRKLSKKELRDLFPFQNSHINEHELMGDLNKGRIVAGTPLISFSYPDIDLTVYRVKRIYFNSVSRVEESLSAAY